MISNELIPRRLPRPPWGRLNPVALEDALDRCLADVLTEVGQRSLDQFAAPSAIFGDHANRKTPDSANNAWATGATKGAAVVRYGNEFSVPMEARVGCHDIAPCRQ